MTLSFTKQHVSNQTGGGCEKGEAEMCQQEVSGGTGRPEGQTDGPRHKDASGGEASTPVCPHTLAGGCTSNKRQGSAPQGHGGLKLCESRNRESFICVFHACVCVCVSGSAAAATSWPHLDMQVQSGASGVSVEPVGLEAGLSCRESLLVWEAPFVLGANDYSSGR